MAYCTLHRAVYTTTAKCPECKAQNLTKRTAHRAGSLESCIERLARLQTTTETGVGADAFARKIDAMILACRAVLEGAS
jgi:hypothetical protein